MEFDPTGVNGEKDTRDGGQPSVTDNTDLDSSSADPGGTGEKSKGDKRVVDAERFSQLLADSKAYKEMTSGVASVNDRLERVKKALVGEAETSQDAQDSEVQSIATRYNVPKEFVLEMINTATAKAERSFEGKLKPLQTQQAVAEWSRELNDLKSSIPDAASLSRAEEDELRKLAVQPAYQKLPLSEVWKLYSYDKQDRSTAETGRSGARSFAEEGDTKMGALDQELEALRKKRR